MARPREVAGIRPDGRLRPNARRILTVRIAEVHSYDEAVADPANIRELHDMRIAFKRLRYLLEIFAVAFPADLDWYIARVRGMQDLLGDIHDCDVQIPALTAHLGTLQRAAEQEPPPPGADPRPGIRRLITMRARRRTELFGLFTREWAAMKDERFRARLETALGIG